MIDLHSHSNCSDGSDPPEYLARLADQIGLAALALTDHDTLDGVDAFLDWQSRVSARLIAGIELSCEFAGRDLHVLGLFVNHRDTLFKERVHGLRLRRNKRNLKMFQKLKAMDIDMPADEGQGLITRAHMAEMLLKTGKVATWAEAFEKYLGESGMAYVPFEFLSPDEAFQWVREAGGIPIIAHPGRFMRGRFAWDVAMPELRKRGAQGIETFYSDHSDAETSYFMNLCKTLDMPPSGGSDYHGRRKPGCNLGKGWGALEVPDWVLDGLMGALRQG
jgi:predicted metal-dependent phosphoesterase TrpH